ncbi:MAG: DoxX family protein [Pseudomonadota bacterium]
MLLARIYNSFFRGLQGLCEDWLIGTLGRLVFAGVLLMYFLNSAMTKLGDGVNGLFNLSVGAYAQILPKAMEASGFDPSALTQTQKLIVYAGTYGEIILPICVVIGLFTRLSALGMIVFVGVMTWTDITQHGADAATIGAWFERTSGSAIADQRSLWVFLLIVIVLKGPGPFSVDAILGRFRGNH